MDPDRYGRVLRDALVEHHARSRFGDCAEYATWDEITEEERDNNREVASTVIAAARAEIVAEWVRETGVEEVLLDMITWAISGDGGPIPPEAMFPGLREDVERARALLARIKAAKENQNK